MSARQKTKDEKTWEWVILIGSLALVGFRGVPMLVHWVNARLHPVPAAPAPVDPTPEDAAEPGVTFVIDRMFVDQQLTEQAPYHAPGGDWIFLDAHLESGTRFGFGWTHGSAGNEAAFGKALWTVPDPASGAALVTVFARAFQGKLPAAEPERALEPRPFAIVALADATARGEHGGGFSGVGTWHTSKLFLQRPGIEAELFFNVDMRSKRGEFTEKDPGYANHLLAFMARELRDGPPLPQTPDNDPRLSLVGPKLGALRALGPAGATFRAFEAGSTRVIYSAVQGPGTRLVSAPCAGPGAEQEIISLEHGFGSMACSKAGTACLIEQTPQRDADSFNVDDPRDFFWVQRAPKRVVPLSGPWERRAFPTKVALSPDGKFSALDDRVEPPGTMQIHSVLYFVNADDLAHPVSYSKPPFRLDVVGWQGTAEALRAVVRDEPPEGTSHFWLVDPTNGAATQLAQPPTDSEDPALSPDGKHRYSANGDAELVISDVASGAARTFTVAPRERYNFDGHEPRWRGSRYLEFSPEQLGFIDIDRMKLSFFLEPNSKLNSIEFDPTFSWAVVKDESQLKIAPIIVR